jgi:MFS family permease
MASPDAAALPMATSPEVRREGISTTAAALIGLALGPSAIAVLSFGVFVRPMEMEFGWSRVQVSLAATLVSYMIMLVSPLQGFLTDRWGPRRVILCSIPLFAAGLASFYFLPDSLPAFYLLWGLIPLAAIGLWPLGYLKAVSGWFDRRLGLALGVANAGVGLGSAVVPVVAGAMIAAYGWRTAFAGLAGIVLVVSLPAVFLLLRDPFVRSASAARPASWGLSFDEAVRRPEFHRLAVAFFLLGLSTTALITQQVPMLIDAGWTPQQAAAVQSIFGVGLMFGRIGVGYVIDRIFAPRVMAVVALGGALGCVFYATAPNSPLAYVSSALVGLVVGAEFDVLALLLKRYFGTVAFGKLYGVIFAAFQLACGLGIIGLSWVRSSLGSYSLGFFAFAAILSLAAVVFATARPFTFTAAGEAAR